MNLKIILGDKCNLKCSYCYQNNQRLGKEISNEILLEIATQINNSGHKFNIQFFGGEPLLYLNKIKYFLSIIKDKKSLELNLATNGTCIDELKELESILGYKIPCLQSNKEKISPKRLNNNSSFKVIVTPSNIINFTEKYISDLYSEFQDNIEWFPDTWTSKWNKIAMFDYCELEKKVKRLSNKKIDWVYPTINNNCLICLNKLNQELTVNWNGDIIRCHRMAFYEDNKKYKNEILGNITKEKLIEVKIYNEECIVNKNNLYNEEEGFKFGGIKLFGSCGGGRL
ncbi:MAG: radical SAM protein [Fusobacteriaceae bacterium]